MFATLTNHVVPPVGELAPKAFHHCTLLFRPSSSPTRLNNQLPYCHRKSGIQCDMCITYMNFCMIPSLHETVPPQMHHDPQSLQWIKSSVVQSLIGEGALSYYHKRKGRVSSLHHWFRRHSLEDLPARLQLLLLLASQQ